MLFKYYTRAPATNWFIEGYRGFYANLFNNQVSTKLYLP